MEHEMLNLTQHPASPEQRAAGVFDVPPTLREKLAELLTFEQLPSADEVRARALAIAEMAAALASGADRAEESDGALADSDSGAYALEAMIGGAPYLMAPLESALRDVGIGPVYSFSIRESVEQPQPDGSVRKVSVFRHCGFVAF
jgi:hypothetical protein